MHERHDTEVELIERNGVLGVDCDGRFIPAISGGTGAEIALLTVAAVGAAASAYGTYQSVENQKQTLKTQAKIREEDAAITRMGWRGRRCPTAEEGPRQTGELRCPRWRSRRRRA